MKTKRFVVFVAAGFLALLGVLAQDGPDEEILANPLFATTGTPYPMRIALSEKTQKNQTLYFSAYIFTKTDATDPLKVSLEARELRNEQANAQNPEISFKAKDVIEKGRRTMVLNVKILSEKLGGQSVVIAVRATPASVPIGLSAIAVGPARDLLPEERVASEYDNEPKSVKTPIGVGRH